MTNSINSRLPAPVVQMITMFVGDPVVTLRVNKKWYTHKDKIYEAIYTFFRRDAILSAFFPTPGQTRFRSDGWTQRSPEESAQAYIKHCKDPFACVKTMFQDLRDQLRDCVGRGGLVARETLPKTDVGTLDRARLTTYLKMRTIQLFIEIFAKQTKMPEVQQLVQEGCLKPNADVATLQRGLAKRAKVLNTLLHDKDLVTCSGLKLISMQQTVFCLFTQLGQLTKLEAFTVDGQKFGTALPRSIGKCTRLQSLGLESCRHLRILPAEIAGCKELREVNLYGTNILHLDELDQCPKLEKIELSDHQLEKTLQLTPRTVALLERLKIAIPKREPAPFSEEIYQLQLPPQDIEELDLEELARKS